VDVHGRRDYAAGLDVDNSDCDIGTAALEHYEGTVGADGQVVWVTGRPYSDRGKSPRVYPPGLSRRLGGLIAEGLTDLFQRWRPLGTDVEFRVNQVRAASSIRSLPHLHYASLADVARRYSSAVWLAQCRPSPEGF
jgi:hypothetical protein